MGDYHNTTRLLPFEGDLPDSQQSVSNSFDQLLVEPALAPSAADTATVPPPAGILKPAAQVPAAEPQEPPRRKNATSLFEAMQKEATEAEEAAWRQGELAAERQTHELAQPLRRPAKQQAQQASATEPEAAALESEPPSEPAQPPAAFSRKRKEQPSRGSELVATLLPMPRRPPAASGASSFPKSITSGGGAAVQRSADGGGASSQRPSGGVNGTAQRPSGGLNGAMQHVSSSSQRSSGGSQASLLPDAPGERIAAITLVEASISAMLDSDLDAKHASSLTLRLWQGLWRRGIGL